MLKIAPGFIYTFTVSTYTADCYPATRMAPEHLAPGETEWINSLLRIHERFRKIIQYDFGNLSVSIHNIYTTEFIIEL